SPRRAASRPDDVVEHRRLPLARLDLLPSLLEALGGRRVGVDGELALGLGRDLLHDRATIRHGPHHSAQKSPRTGPFASSTSASNVASANSRTCLVSSDMCENSLRLNRARTLLPGRLMEAGGTPLRTARTRYAATRRPPANGVR